MRPAPFPNHTPATFRGLTGWDEHRTRIGIGFSTFDGEYHQLLLSDLDLRRLGDAVARALPLKFDAYLSGMCFHPERDSGSRYAADAAAGASFAQDPDRNASNASSGDLA